MLRILHDTYLSFDGYGLGLPKQLGFIYPFYDIQKVSTHIRYEFANLPPPHCALYAVPGCS